MCVCSRKQDVLLCAAVLKRCETLRRHRPLSLKCSTTAYVHTCLRERAYTCIYHCLDIAIQQKPCAVCDLKESEKTHEERETQTWRCCRRIIYARLRSHTDVPRERASERKTALLGKSAVIRGSQPRIKFLVHVFACMCALAATMTLP